MGAHVILITLDLELPICHSLKDKRQILKSFIAGLHLKFNVSASEVEHLDKWQRSEIAITAVSNEAKHLDSVSSSILKLAESDHRLVVLNITSERL